MVYSFETYTFCSKTHFPNLDGLIVATGMSGHGFGIGPAYGKIIAEIACGEKSEHNLNRFRFSRFSDGSRLDIGPAI